MADCHGPFTRVIMAGYEGCTFVSSDYLLNDTQLTVAFALLQAPNMMLSICNFVEAHESDHRVNEAGDRAHFGCLIAFCRPGHIYICLLLFSLVAILY